MQINITQQWQPALGFILQEFSVFCSKMMFYGAFCVADKYGL
jgi:hypothetical protein